MLLSISTCAATSRPIIDAADVHISKGTMGAAPDAKPSDDEKKGEGDTDAAAEAAATEKKKDEGQDCLLTVYRCTQVYTYTLVASSSLA